MKSKLFLFAIIAFFAIISSCDPPENEVGDIFFKFQFNVDGEPVELNKLNYINEAGNLYMICDIQMIISNVKLIKSDNSEVVFNTEDFVHYIDYADKNSLIWKLPKLYEKGIYKGIGFVFGLDEEMNTSGRFVNPPLSDMFWPDILGGGYHYMKLNCKWFDESLSNTYLPFNFHLGRISIYDETIDSLSSEPLTFLDNYFEVTGPLNFEIEENNNTFIISINLNNWFNDPNIIDFSKYIDQSIMQNSAIQFMAHQNGENVFDIKLEFTTQPDE